MSSASKLLRSPLPVSSRVPATDFTSSVALQKTRQLTTQASERYAYEHHSAGDLKKTELQVDLGDLRIDVSSPDELGSGDEPALTTFRALLQMQGGTPGYKDFFKSARNPDIPRNGENVGSGGINNTNQPYQRTINWFDDLSAGGGSAYKYKLRTFDPDIIYPHRATTPYFAGDIALGGAIYWEVDGNRVYDSDGGENEYSWSDNQRDNRNFISDSIREFFAQNSGEDLASIFRIPFDYADYHAHPTTSGARWRTSFGKSLQTAINKLGGESGYIQSKFNDWVKQKYADQWLNGKSDRFPGVDRITGIHLMFMIPVTAKFYDILSHANLNAPSAKKIKYTRYDGDKQELFNLFSGNELVGSMTMSNDKYLDRCSTDVTFAFVPVTHPSRIAEHDSSDPYTTTHASGYFQKRVRLLRENGSNRTAAHEFRGGFDAYTNLDHAGYGTNAEKWQTPGIGYTAGASIFSGHDPYKTLLESSL